MCYPIEFYGVCVPFYLWYCLDCFACVALVDSFCVHALWVWHPLSVGEKLMVVSGAIDLVVHIFFENSGVCDESMWLLDLLELDISNCLCLCSTKYDQS